MPEATPDTVRDVLDVGTSAFPDSEIQPHIDDAAALVSARVPEQSMAAPLKRIETLVAAHFVESTAESDHPQVSSVSRGDSSISFEIPAGSDTTEWWERAMMLTNGELTSSGDDTGSSPFVTRDRYVRSVSPSSDGSARAPGTEKEL